MFLPFEHTSVLYFIMKQIMYVIEKYLFIKICFDSQQSSALERGVGVCHSLATKLARALRQQQRFSA